MSQPNKQDEAKSPLTFKIPPAMAEKIQQMVDEKEYDNRAELIRDAIQKLLEWELDQPSVKDAKL